MNFFYVRKAYDNKEIIIKINYKFKLLKKIQKINKENLINTARNKHNQSILLLIKFYFFKVATYIKEKLGFELIF